MNLELLLKSANEHLREGESKSSKYHLNIAVELYNKARGFNSQQLALYIERSINRGFAFVLLERYGKAVADLTKAIEFNPQCPEVYNNRGFAFNSLGKFEEAVADFTKAIQLDPQHSAASYSNRGNSYRLTCENRLAEEDYRRALKIFNANPRKKSDDYRWAIRAERGLMKLGITTENPIEQLALKEGILTQKQLAEFYQHEK